MAKNAAALQPTARREIALRDGSPSGRGRDAGASSTRDGCANGVPWRFSASGFGSSGAEGPWTRRWSSAFAFEASSSGRLPTTRGSPQAYGGVLATTPRRWHRSFDVRRGYG